MPARRRAGARAAVPLAVAVGGFGVSFGVLARSAHLGVAAPLFMSAVTFAGSAQFAAVSIIAAGGGVTGAIVAAVLLNLRYGPIGLTVAPHWRSRPLRRLIGSQLIIDESWAIATTTDGSVDVPRLVGAGALLWASWVGGTAVGLVAGDAIGSPARLGLDAALPALFLTLVVPQLRTRRALAAGMAGAVISLATVPLAPAGVPIIAAGVAVTLGLWRP